MKKILLFAMIVALAGCAKDYSKIEKGTSTEELVKEYGEPDDKVEAVLGIEIWRYSDNLVTIFAGKVAEVKLDYDSAKIVMEESHEAMEEVNKDLDELKKDLNIETDINFD